MRDPVERVVQFVIGQKQQASTAHARALWARRLPSLLAGVRAVVAAFAGGLEEEADGPLVSVLCDPRHERSPLVIAFARREGGAAGILSMRPEPAVKEIGASACFRCEEDGIVYGFRYPFHGVQQDVRPERFADLGEPDGVGAVPLGNAVADFLEWAAVGGGCGSRKLRFWAPPTPAEPAAPIRLGAVAA
jgi:hypothetical protein